MTLSRGHLNACSSKATTQNHFMVKPQRQTALLLTGSLLIVSVLGAAAHAQSTAPPAEDRTSPATQMSPRTAEGSPPIAVTPRNVTSKDVDEAFGRADVNSDGRLDRREAELFAPVGQRFEELDSNNDNYVSREELRKMAGS